MKKIITNHYDLLESEMTEVVKRVKVLLINSKKEILLGYSHNTYQFPGGHVEYGEALIDAVNREIKEETGIELNISELEPFACAYGYYKDYPEKGKNRKTEIYYYEVNTDLEPNLDNTEYTDDEKDGNFHLRYVPLSKIEEELQSNVRKYDDAKGIAEEMIKLLKIYKDSF